MNTTQTRGNAPRLRSLVAAFVVLAALASALNVGSASAATQTGWLGSPGRYSVAQASLGWTISPNQTWDGVCGVSSCRAMGRSVNLWVPGPQVWRSPAIAGPQAVLLFAELHQYTATGWRIVRTHEAWLSPNDGPLIFGATTFKDLTAGYYVVRHKIGWGNSAGWAGWVQVDYNHQSDYSCNTPQGVLCTTNPQGYIYLH